MARKHRIPVPVYPETKDYISAPKFNCNSEYDIKVTVFDNNLVKIRKYDKSIKSDGNNQYGKRKSSNSDGIISNVSLNRTRKNIIETIMNNEDKFVSFITLTFAENITEPKKAYDYLRKFLRRINDYMKEKGESFYYIFVPELQKRGAIHFHGLTNIKLGSAIIPKREKLKIRSKGKARVLEYYDIPFWSETIRSDNYSKSDNNSLGYSSAVPIKKEFEDFNPGIYMAKYLTKGMDNIFFGHQKVLKSKNLSTPKTYELHKDVIKEMKCLTAFEKEFDSNLISKYTNDNKTNKCAREFEEFTYKIDDDAREDLCYELGCAIILDYY